MEINKVIIEQESPRFEAAVKRITELQDMLAIQLDADEILAKLKEPFEAHEIEWRAAQSGFKKDGQPWVKVLAYIDARAVMDRLDDVVGADCWKDAYRKEGNATICTLSLKINGEWVSKEDGSDDTDIEAVKGGLSGAMKRAAVKWGISRYLYNLSEGFGKVLQERGEHGIRFDVKDKQSGQFSTFYFEPPRLPEWALPSKAKKMEEGTKANLEAAKAIVQHQQSGDPGQLDFNLAVFRADIAGCKSMDDLKTLWLFALPAVQKLDKNVQYELNDLKELKKKDLSSR